MKKSPNSLKRQRNGLLAVIHIAKKDLGIDDGTYRDILARWGVSSSSALSIPEMEELVNYFQDKGFRVVSKKRPDRAGQIEALRDRIRTEALVLENGQERLLGLVEAKAGVERLEWVRSVPKLKQILRILAIFREQEEAQGSKLTAQGGHHGTIFD